jgi:peptidoglycan/LPS O-acetylase OafA/YrhL
VPTNALLSAPTTEPATRYLPGLDGLRGIAVLGVLGYHFGAPMLSGGYLGVDMFFVISGFVVTRNLARMAGDRRWFRTFYGRRVARLMPAMLVLLLAVSVSWMVSGDVGAGRGTALAGALTMSANLAAVHLGADLHGIVNLWSLGVEWHYYMLAPLLVMVGASWLQPGWRAGGILVLASVLAAVRLGLLVEGSFSSFNVYIHTFTRLDGLLLGTAIALAPVAVMRLIPSGSLASPAFVVLSLLLVVGPAWNQWVTVTLGLIVPIAGLLTGLVVASESSGATLPRLRLVLEARGLLWVGRRSYSIYLWHYLLGVTLVADGSERWQGVGVFALQMAVSFVVAAASYRFVEQPARRAINDRL